MKLVFVIVVMMVCAIGATATPSAADEVAIQEEIRKRIELMRAEGRLTVDGATLTARDFVPAFYEGRHFRPAFGNSDNVVVLIDAIESSADDGLNPRDYHIETIRTLRRAMGSTPDSVTAAQLDIVLADALFSLAHHLFFGKIDPSTLDPNWNIEPPANDRGLVAEAEAALATGDVPGLIDRARLQDPYYKALKSALRSHREISSAGGWPQVPAGPALKPGATDPRVSVLRRRLAVGGDYDWTATGPTDVYDPALEAGVRRFQARHRLDVDGVVGPATLAALNVPVEERIGQIRANMERARWILRSVADDYILVNIAGFYVQAVRNRKVVWEGRAIVGRPYRATPIFSAKMTYLVFNPTWTVPPTILREDILPKAKTDPGFVSSKGYRVVDSKGGTVDPSRIDWQRAANGTFPYQIVQPAGPDNALGSIKFMFPNPHLVYLHDTPSQALFDRAERTFSSGCIRVENPFDLAELLLGGKSGWTRDKMEQVKASGATTTVYLDSPQTVLLLYWTVDPDLSGNVRFLGDIYGRDKAIIAALDRR